jgi:protein involved in polysaccharide export with SLBB domain
VNGAVKSPFGTTFDPSLTVHDLLTMAGGFEVGAAYDRVEVFRLNVSDKKSSFDVLTLEVDEDYNPKSDFQLQPFDQIVVRMTPDFTTGRTVELNGRVKYPGVYLLDDNKTQLWEVIEMAGGLLDDADPYARVFRTHEGRGNIGVNLTKAKNNKKKMDSDLILMDGDVINISRQENIVIIREIGTRMGQYVPAEFSASNKVVVYDGGHSAGWYIRHYAGGFQKVANKNSVTVTFPNNQTEGTKRGLFGIRRYPTVEPGGVVTVSIDREKREKLDTPKEKVNWGQTFNQSVSTLTSVISLIILVDRLK